MTCAMSSTIAGSASLAGMLRSLLQGECFDGPDKIRLGVAIRFPVSGMQLGQLELECRIGVGRVGMGAQVIPEGDMPPMFITALRHNVEVVRARMALPQ